MEKRDPQTTPKKTHHSCEREACSINRRTDTMLGNTEEQHDEMIDDLARRARCDDAEVMRLWREVGLPEYFLGYGGTNHKLVAFAARIREAESNAR
jgi:hypothetical protein